MGFEAALIPPSSSSSRSRGGGSGDAVDLNLAISMLQEVPKVNTFTGGGKNKNALRQSIKIKSEKS